VSQSKTGNASHLHRFPASHIPTVAWTDGVDPEHRPRDVDETPDHAPNIYQRNAREPV
jgi:hypothetical protein